MRSKTLLVSNILVSLYSALLSWFFIGFAILDMGGKGIINAIGGFFETAFKTIHIDLAIINYLSMLGILALVHLAVFLIGSTVAWVAYAKKSHAVAIASAVIFLIGTICSPINFIFGLPVTVATFIGANNQKNLNHTEN